MGDPQKEDALTCLSTSNALENLKSVCSKLRQVLNKLQSYKEKAKKVNTEEIKAQKQQAILLLGVIKTYLRDTFLAANDWKTQIQTKKEFVDGHFLKLQNLLYEKDHLLSQIQHCRSFR